MTLRLEASGDGPFLEALYASTREAELENIPHWSAVQKSAFVHMQFEAQHVHYVAHYPRARFDVIELDGRPVGRLYLAEVDDEIRLMDITLAPEHRRRGLGRRLTESLLAFARERGKAVTLHVEEDNPAFRMYERLGFVIVGEQSFYKKMRSPPPEPIS